MIARFRVANNNPYPVKDVVVRCSHTLPATNETRVFSNWYTVNETIALATEIAINDTDLGNLHPDVVATHCETAKYRPAS